MKLLTWGFTRWGRVKAVFDSHPSSVVLFGRINEFYIVNYVRWNDSDPKVSRNTLCEMELLINEQLNCLPEYKSRKSKKQDFF